MKINTELLLHPSDKAALQALKAIPGFQQLVKAYMGIMNERQMRIINMSTNLRLGPEQMPEYYNMLPPICEKLGIPVPELYMELNVDPNAYTYGDTNPYIVITSGLIDTMPAELIPTVLAHECGHIACRHTLYSTMGRFLLYGIDRLAGGLMSLVTTSLLTAFMYWMRCSEFSADRAAVFCDGTPDKMAEVCFRFSGFPKSISAQTSMEAFLEQAREYRRMVTDDKWNKALEFMLLKNVSHPFNAVRALECREWAASEQFGRLNDPNLILPEAEAPAAEKPAQMSIGDLAQSAADAVGGLLGSLFKSSKPAFNLPDGYTLLKNAQPSDLGLPEGAMVYGLRRGNLSCLLTAHIIESPDMPVNDPDSLKTENTLEVKNGLTASGQPFICSISLSGNEYALNANVKLDGSIYSIKATCRSDDSLSGRPHEAVSELKRVIEFITENY